MCPDTNPAKKSRAAIIGDACLLTAASMAVFTAAAGGIIQMGWASPLGDTPPPGPMGLVFQVFVVILMVGGVVVGPLATWLLHGRRIGLAAVLGALLGVALGVAVIQAIGLLAVVVGMAIGRLTGVEVAGPIAIVSVLGGAFLAVTVWLDIDGVRDLSPSRREHRRLDIARLVATAAIAVFLAVTIGINVANPKSEVGEAGIFAIAAGIFGAVVVAVADAITGLMEKRAAGSSS